jgi:hypothetical protein
MSHIDGMPEWSNRLVGQRRKKPATNEWLSGIVMRFLRCCFCIDGIDYLNMHAKVRIPVTETLRKHLISARTMMMASDVLLPSVVGRLLESHVAFLDLGFYRFKFEPAANRAPMIADIHRHLKGVCQVKEITDGGNGDGPPPKKAKLA